MYSHADLSASVQNMVTNSDGGRALTCKVAYNSVMSIHITVGAIPSQTIMAHLSYVWAVADTSVGGRAVTLSGTFRGWPLAMSKKVTFRNFPPSKSASTL